MDIVSYILSKRYCDNSLIGLGALKGANCTVKDIVHQDGINTVTFEWTGTDGTTKTRDMVVYDGTPIYVWESGNTYHYGDLAIYESQFYRCIVENNDATFDSTKWNEIGSPDGNYDIVQSVNLLPTRFTAADRKLYYVIDENCFYLWNGTAWVKTISNNIADLDDVNLDDLTEGDVLVWDSVNEKWVNKAKFDEYKTAFTGTEEEWDALTPAQQNVYDIINITNDGDVLNLGVYLEKKTAMPVASEDVENKIYLYTGTTTQNYKKGVVYQCVSDGEVVPTYSWVALIDFGTAAIKNSTDRVSPNNTNLVESQSVYSAINTALSSIYTPRGDITCAELTSDLLIAANVGNIYETSDSGTTSALFLQGVGVSIPTGSNVGIINAGQGRILFNLMANAFDLTDYQKKDLTQAVEGQTTVEGALGALSTNKQPKTLVTPLTIGGSEQTTVEGALGALSANKQDSLTFDNAPTENSNNPVKSGGIYAVNQTLTSALTNNVNVNGCKNLFLVDLEKIISTNKGGTWNGNTFTQKGATYTINDNDSVTFGGTPTDYTQIVFPQNVSKADKYMLSGLSGCTNVVFGGCSMYLNDTLVSSIVINSKQNTELDLSSYTFDRITIDVKRLTNNTAMSGTAFIMLCLKSDWDLDQTYVPPTKTNRQLTTDKVGWDDYSEVGAVNMLDSAIATQTVNDITVTNNGDGSYTVNCSSTEHYSANFISTKKVTLPKGTYKWTASADGKSPIGSNDCYAFIRGVNGTVDWYRSYQSSHGYGIITLTQESEIEFGLTVAGNATVSDLTFKPMITSPSYNGPYVPYTKTNQQLTKETTALLDNLEVNGAVNILPIDLNFIKANNSAASWSGNACTHNGVTYTIDEANGKITVNGTASARSTLQVYNAIAGDLFKKNFKYLAKVFNNNFNTVNGYYVQLYMTNSPYTRIDAFTGNNFVVPDSFFDNSIRVSIQIVVEDGKSVDNQVITPLIAFGNYTGGFEKYAKSNRELTEDVYGHNLNKYYIYDYADTTLFNAALKTKTLDQIVAKLAAPAKICICTVSADLTSTLALDLIDKGLLDSISNMFWLEISKLGDYQNRAYARCTYLNGWATAVEKIAFVNNGTWQASKTLTN